MRSVALIGANGYGLVHRRAMVPLQQAGRLALVAMADLAPVRDEPGAPVPPEATIHTDYRELLATAGADVVIVATPPHTHLELATAAARSGADVLLEKPPVRSLAEHRALSGVLAETGRVCQVGFQALGSTGLARLCDAITGGDLGGVSAVSAVGAWQRPDAYYARASWAGRRSVNGEPVLDGALANPFAHALMQCFAVAEAAAGAPVWPVTVEVERYRARPIDVDDTTVVRIRLDRGPMVVVAVTLCADRPGDPEIWVHSRRGRAELGYTADRLRLPGEPAAREVPGRTGLLENLLSNRDDLVAPLRRTAPFTAVVEAVAAGPEPSTIDTGYHAAHGEGPDRVVTVPGITEVLRRAAGALALPSELGAAWAATPVATELQQPGG